MNAEVAKASLKWHTARSDLGSKAYLVNQPQEIDQNVFISPYHRVSLKKSNLLVQLTT